MRARCIFLAFPLLFWAGSSLSQPADVGESVEGSEPGEEAETLPPPAAIPTAELAPPPPPPPPKPPAAPTTEPSPTPKPWYPHTVGAASTSPSQEPATSEPTRDMSRDFWQVHAGFRVSWIPNEGYDPFDDNDVFTHLSLGASRAFLLGSSFSIAPGVLWETGATESSARGAGTELFIHRLGAVAEGRFHLDRDVYLLAKLVPQALHSRAYLSDASSPEQLRQRTWRFGVDATAGAAWNFPRTLGSPNARVQFWLISEVGYGWTMSKDLVLSPDVDDDDPQSRMRLDLGSMAMSGVMMRVNVAMTF